MSRRRMRERAMRILFQVEVGKNPVDEILDYEIEKLKLKKTAKELNFLKNLVKTALEKQSQIDEIIEKYTENWSIDRLGKVDLVILRLALTEIIFIEDVPYKVSINEAIELGKRYSTGDSPSYINGVLDRAFRNLKGEER